MTGKNLLDSAVLNLGYRKSDDVYEAGITFINQVCADICTAMGKPFYPINTLGDRLCLPENVLSNIALYGVAMYLALYRGDGDKNQFFASLYSQKRRLLSSSSKITDKLPRGDD